MSKEQFDKNLFCNELSAMHSSKIRFDKNDNAAAIKLQKLIDWTNKHPILFMFSRKKVLSELSKIKDTHHIAHCMATDYTKTCFIAVMFWVFSYYTDGFHFLPYTDNHDCYADYCEYDS